MVAKYHFEKNFFSSPVDTGAIALCQIGRMHCSPGMVVGNHIHLHWLELTVVRAGGGTVITNGVPCRVGEGDIYLSLPCDAHEIVSDEAQPLQFDFFSFYATAAALREEEEQIVAARSSPTDRLLRERRIPPLVEAAIDELKEQGPYTDMLLASLCHQIVVYLFRALSAAPAGAPVQTRPAEALCYRLMNYMDTHLDSLKNLRELSGVTGYSYGYLSTVFKNTMGKNLSDHFHEKRLQLARLLVLEERLTVTEIADTLHYASVYVFSRAFAARFGLSPRLYRQRMRASGNNKQ